MGDRRLLVAGRLLTPDGVVEGGACVEVEDGYVARLGVRAGIEAAPGMPVDDFGEEAWLAPGYVDLQVNGGGGSDLMAGAGALAVAGRAHLARGVTAWCPTVITAPRDALLRALDDLSRDLERADPATLPACLGLHVEGPFIAHGARGVHDPGALRDPDLAEVDAWQAAARGRVRLVTLAPERRDALAAVRGLVSHGIAVSIGHTEATAEQVRAAADAGARLVTHTFNGMRGLHHREVGPVGMALLDERLHPAIIPDGLHVGADALRLFHRLAGSRHRSGRGFLVTDAASPAGLPAGATGTFTIGGRPVAYAAGRVTDEAGRLAGSALTMDAAAATYARLAGASPESALRMATERPARALEAGLAAGPGAAASPLASAGRLVVGGPADLVAVGPDLALLAVYRLGRRVGV
ncbi:MAG TPA: amidohydrolase family protein [Thermodesulfobacteriota bacterium]